jgi:two-component system, OmpR family, phosphate regulon sensor histidine kinase PhoR
VLRPSFLRLWVALLIGGVISGCIALALAPVVQSRFIVALIALALFAAAAAWTLRSFEKKQSIREQELLEFARLLRSGNLAARIAVPTQNRRPPFADVELALNHASNVLEKQFHALEDSRRGLIALLDSMQEGVIAVDENARVIWSNRVVEELANCRVVAGSALVQTLRDPVLLSAVEQALKGETVIREKTQSISPGLSFEVTATHMAGGGAVAVLRDVTSVERIEKTRRDFIANVSHELRTPLTSVSGYVETLLEDESYSPTAREFLSIILKNARRMNRLTEDLLALARVESGEHELHPEAVPASALLLEAKDSLHGFVEDHSLTLEIEASTDVPVIADRDAVQQVLSNLIENACKYAAGGGRILLGAREKDGEVELWVRDFGPGIQSEHLQRIFERFYRVDKARSMESGGTGLGLAIAKHIMLAHRGTIRAESILLRGSTFILTFPAAPASPEPDGQTAQPPDAVESRN